MIATTETEVEEGIHFGMPDRTYHAARAFSASGVKSLMASKLTYWYRNIAKGDDSDSPAMRWGRIVHSALLEPARFAERFAIPPAKESFPDLLETVPQLKAKCAGLGLPTGGLKGELIDRIVKSGHPCHIWEKIQERFLIESNSKEPISEGESNRLAALTEAVQGHPHASRMLSNGYPEVSFFVRDPATGVMLKSRMDWLKPKATIDLKTFTVKRNERPDDAAHRAIYYEGYDKQAVFYSKVRELARRKLKAGKIAVHGAVDPNFLDTFAETQSHGFGFVFVEASEPFHIVLREVVRKSNVFDTPNLFWDAAETAIEEAIQLYADCLEQFGDRPWRECDPPRQLSDLDMPQVIFRQETHA